MIYYEVVRVHSVKEASVSLSSMLLQRLPRSSSLLLCIDDESRRLLSEAIESLKPAVVLVLPVEAFQSLSAPLNECLSRLTELSSLSPHWVLFTSLEMIIDTSDFNRWRDICQTYQDRYNVVGLYISEMSDFSGIAFTIPWNTACAWYIDSATPLAFEACNGMEEYGAMQGRSVALLRGLPLRWEAARDGRWDRKMKTKNERLLASLGVDREEDVEEGARIKVDTLLLPACL